MSLKKTLWNLDHTGKGCLEQFPVLLLLGFHSTMAASSSNDVVQAVLEQLTDIEQTKIPAAAIPLNNGLKSSTARIMPMH